MLKAIIVIWVLIVLSIVCWFLVFGEGGDGYGD